MKNKKIKILVVVLSVLIAGIIGIEVVARFLLGLGDPPISCADSEIDYLFAPNQHCFRFGNHIIYNAFSMRSSHDPGKETSSIKRRILILGDSVINGGVLTDQKDMANELLDSYMRKSQKGDAYNISAGSWGPMNYAAYLRKYGTFGATDVVVEVNSHDLWEDDPAETGGKLVGKDISLPDRKPWCATYEGVMRYFLPKLRRWLKVAHINNKVDVARWGTSLKDPIVIANLEALEYIYSLPFRNKYMVIHRSQKEWLSGGMPIGEAQFRSHAKSLGVKVLTLKLDVETDYRDNIHPNALGQKKLYELLKSTLFGD